MRTELLNRDDLADRLKVRPETINRWLARGMIPGPVTIKGTRWYDYRATVKALLTFSKAMLAG